MRRLASSERWTSVLLTAMGLAPFAACGGVSIEPGGGAGAGSAGTGGAAAGGGVAGTRSVPPDPPVAGWTGAGGDIVQTGGAGGSVVQTGGAGGNVVQTGGASGSVVQTGGVGGDIVQTGGAGGDAGSGGALPCGGSGAGSACTGGSTGVGGNVNPHPCDDPIVDEYGIVHCAAGFVHRPQRETCVSELPRANVPIYAPNVDAGYRSECASDSDCTARPHGFCSYVGTGPNCFYGCVNDAECGDAQVCSCRSPVGTCVPATCATDAACGSTLCAAYTANLACGGGIGYACQSSIDECVSDQQCAPGMCGLVPLPSPHRACTVRCVQGRPFLVDGEERTAVATNEAGWAALVAPRVEHLKTVERAALAEGWARIGLMEHASIAAFARFTMQLMSVGAPAALVEASMAAMRDETVHTRLAFGLASAYAGSPRGPGALDIRGSLAADDLGTIVVTTIHEGCIGETVAAMEAAEAALHATDPAVREVLNAITADETRHAELAWRFVHWALSGGGNALRDTVRATFANALRDLPPRPSSIATGLDEVLLAGGILPQDMSEDVRRAALHDVVRVCAHEMLSRTMAHAA